MAQPFDLAQLGLAEDSELAGLLRTYPDIEPLRFGDEETLVAPGDDAHDIFLVVRGTVVVEPPDGAARQELAILEATPDAPIFVGEMAYLDAGDRSARVRSALNSFALRLRPAHIDAIIAGYPLFTRVLCREFARRLRQTGARLAELHRLHALPGETMNVAAGELLFTAGMPADRLYQLLDGRVSLTAASGAEETVRPGPEGTLLAAEDFLRARAWSATATASTACFVVCSPAEARLAVIRRFPALAAGLLAATP